MLDRLDYDRHSYITDSGLGLYVYIYLKTISTTLSTVLAKLKTQYM